MSLGNYRSYTALYKDLLSQLGGNEEMPDWIHFYQNNNDIGQISTETLRAKVMDEMVANMPDGEDFDTAYQAIQFGLKYNSFSLSDGIKETIVKVIEGFDKIYNP